MSKHPEWPYTVLRFMVLVAFWHGSTQAQQVSDKPPTFQKLEGFQDVAGSLIEVGNMPRVRNQGNFPMCAGFASATMLQKHICDTEVDSIGQKKYPNCARDFPAEKEVSPWGMIAWSQTVIQSRMTDYWVEQKQQRGNTKEWDEYENQLSKKNDKDLSELLGRDVKSANVSLSELTSIPTEGASSAMSFLYADGAKFYYPESCYSSEYVANKWGVNQSIYETALQKMRSAYFKNKLKHGEDLMRVSDIPYILQSIDDLWGVKLTRSQLNDALHEESFGEFWFRATLGSGDDCNYARFQKPAYLHSVKVVAKEVDTLQLKIIEKIKEVLHKGKPILLEAVAIRYKNDGEVLALHNMVLDGYNRICTPKNKNQCRDVVRIQNSWGEAWQKKYGDGWIDAESLFKNMVKEEKTGQLRIYLHWLDTERDSAWNVSQ